MDGLLGVAGMMTLLVMKWIIPENSLRLAPVSLSSLFIIYLFFRGFSSETPLFSSTNQWESGMISNMFLPQT